MTTNLSVYQFRITLLDIKPPVWRRIQVPANYSFWDLHVAIQDSMGWLDYHLHEFRLKKPDGSKVVEIGIPDDNLGRDVLPGWEQRIADFMPEPGMGAAYYYDFGDDWRHEVLLEDILPRETSVNYPVCTAGERACPPEDCGGPPGYENLLEVLAGPESEEKRDMGAWLKGHAKNYYPYRPEHFDPAEIKFWDPAKRWQLAFGD